MILSSKVYFNAIFSWTYFNPNVANIEQVISSGALRYLRNYTKKSNRRIRIEKFGNQ